MAKANYWQRGETLDYLNSTNETIEAGTIITLGTRIGVAGTTIHPREMGDLHVAGVYRIPKTGAGEIAMGAAVYFDGTGITDIAEGNTPAGYAAAASMDSNEVLVKLPG